MRVEFLATRRSAPHSLQLADRLVYENFLHRLPKDNHQNPLRIIIQTKERRIMWWKVTLMRSGIGLSKRRNDTLVALGLRKRFRTVYKPVNPQTAGLLLRVKELVKLELVNETESREDVKARRRPAKGYIVESVGKGYVPPVDAAGVQERTA